VQKGRSHTESGPRLSSYSFIALSPHCERVTSALGAASDNMLDVVVGPVRLSLDIDHYNSVADLPLEARSVAKDPECLI